MCSGPASRALLVSLASLLISPLCQAGAKNRSVRVRPFVPTAMQYNRSLPFQVPSPQSAETRNPSGVPIGGLNQGRGPVKVQAQNEEQALA